MNCDTSKKAVPVTETEFRKHFSHLKYPSKPGKNQPQQPVNHFCPLQSVFWPLLRIKCKFSQNPAMQWPDFKILKLQADIP